MLALHIERGEIRVGQHQRIIHHDDVEIWNFDLNSKYSEVVIYSNDDEEPGVMLLAGERTRGLDEKKRGNATWIEFPRHPGWHIMAEAPRYTLRVVIWRVGDATKD